MFSRHRLLHRSRAALAASIALVIVSCGDDTDYGLGKMFPVGGTVTYNGKPLEKGEIHFFPEDPSGVRASGTVENGSYAMETAGEKNGARVGKYKVGIIAKEDSEALAKAEFQKAMAKFPNATKNMQENMNRIPPEIRTKAMREAKSLIPAGYGDIRTTTLTADVIEKPNTFDFKLSDAEAPPEPPKVGKSAKSRASDR